MQWSTTERFECHVTSWAKTYDKGSLVAATDDVMNDEGFSSLCIDSTVIERLSMLRVWESRRQHQSSRWSLRLSRERRRRPCRGRQRWRNAGHGRPSPSRCSWRSSDRRQKRRSSHFVSTNDRSGREALICHTTKSSLTPLALPQADMTHWSFEAMKMTWSTPFFLSSSALLR